MKSVLPSRLGVLFLCLVGCLPGSLQVWEGDLSIPGGAPPSALRRIVAIEGNLVVTGAASGQLDLPSLRTVAGNVVIRDSPRLETLEGLERLAWIGGGLIVEGNSRLVHLMGLGTLTHVGGSVWIRKNATLESLDGLDGLAVIGRSLEVTENPVLASLWQLRHVQSIGGGIVVRVQPALLSLQGLEPTNLQGAVTVEENLSLGEQEIEAWLVRLEEKGWTGRQRTERVWIPPTHGPGINELLAGLARSDALAPDRGVTIGRREDQATVFPEAPKLKGTLSGEQVDHVEGRHRNQIRFCYERELARVRGFGEPPAISTTEYMRGGKVTMGWTIDDFGNTADVRIIEDAFSDGRAARCMQQRIRRWRFPESPVGATTDVVFTWKLQPPEKAGEEP